MNSLLIRLYNNLIIKEDHFENFDWKYVRIYKTKTEAVMFYPNCSIVINSNKFQPKMSKQQELLSIVKHN